MFSGRRHKRSVIKPFTWNFLVPFCVCHVLVVRIFGIESSKELHWRVQVGHCRLAGCIVIFGREEWLETLQAMACG